MSHPPTEPSHPMRVLLFGTRGYMSVVLEQLIGDGRVEVVGLCSAPPPGLTMRLRAAAGALQRRLRLRGRSDFVVDDPFAACTDPWRLARRNGIPCLPYQAVKTPEFLERVRAMHPDMILVAGFPRLIPPTVIAAPSRIGINLHPSQLPRHRGGTPNRWIVRNGETETGITAHVLDEAFDTGDILGQWPVTLETGMSWGDAEERILSRLPDVVDAVVRQGAANDWTRVPQDPSAGEYEPPYRGVYAWIDWTQTAKEIQQACLASRPKTGALTAIDGRPQCIWSVAPVDPANGAATPGTILRYDTKGRPVVACGGGDEIMIDKIVAYGAVLESRGWGDFEPGRRFDAAPGVDA